MLLKDVGKAAFRSSMLESIWCNKLVWMGSRWSLGDNEVAAGANQLVLKESVLKVGLQDPLTSLSHSLPYCAITYL